MKLHIGDTAGTLLTRQVEAAPTMAFGLLAREACARRIARSHSPFFPVTDRTGGPRPHKVSFEQWLGVIQRVADQGCEARACCFARADRRPRPEEIVPVGVIQGLGPGVCGLAFGSEGHAACSRRTGVGGSRAGRPIRQARWPSTVHRCSGWRSRRTQDVGLPVRPSASGGAAAACPPVHGLRTRPADGRGRLPGGSRRSSPEASGRGSGRSVGRSPRPGCAP